MKERVSREVKTGEMARGWIYRRFCVSEEPKGANGKPMVLFDEKAQQAGWIYERFGVSEK